MLAFDDPRWTELEGGYRVRYDPRPTLRRLEAAVDRPACWAELWDELHHQGDVGLASYASVPHLVRIAPSLPPEEWNVFSLVGTIALLAGRNRNPPVPEWLQPSYATALSELAALARERLVTLHDAALVRCCLGVLALEAGLHHHAKLLLHFDDSEIPGLIAMFDAADG